MGGRNPVARSWLLNGSPMSLPWPGRPVRLQAGGVDPAARSCPVPLARIRAIPPEIDRLPIKAAKQPNASENYNEVPNDG
jgi:hypothetical protein